MDLPQVHTCCFGMFSLKTGSLIVGIVTFLMELSSHGYNLTIGTGGLTSLLHSIYVVLIICGIVASALLIFGVMQNQKRFVFFFIVIFSLLIIATIVLTIYYLITTNNQSHTVDSLVSAAVYCLVILYCLIVVNSYYRIM